MNLIKYIILLSLLSSCDLYCPVTAKIVAIGGCDHYGRCGVTTDTGITGFADYPVIGQTTEIYRECEVSH